MVEDAAPATISGSRAFLARTAGSEFRNAVILVDATAAAKFVRIGVGDAAVPAGTALP